MLRPLPLLGAFVRRDFLNSRSYRLSFGFSFIDPFVQLALFYFISKLVGGNGGIATGDDYFAFVVVGLSVITIFAASLRSLSENIRRDQLTGALEVQLMTPSPAWLLIAASAVYNVLEALIEAALLILVAVVVFGFRPTLGTDALVTVLVVLPSCILLFGGLGILIASLTIVYKQTAGAVGFAIVIIGLLSGVYFPTELLPALLQTLAEASPLTWGLELMRAGFLGGSLEALKVFGLILAAIVAPLVGCAVFSAAVNGARVNGSLAQY